MSSSWLMLSFLVFLIISICNGKKKFLSFSGGGIRAAMGAYWTMRAIQERKELGDIEAISVISGGSWGFILWLYEDTDSVWNANHHILTNLYRDGLWGPIGPQQQTSYAKILGVTYKHSDLSWFVRWRNQIRIHITDATTLKGDRQEEQFDAIRNQMEKKGLRGVTLYFVVESVKLVHSSLFKTGVLKLKDYKPAEFEDYCWFKSIPTASDVTSTETFECSKNVGSESYTMKLLSIRRRAGRRGKEIRTMKHHDHVRILDVLTYCSSAWATDAGMAGTIHRHTTKKVGIWAMEIGAGSVKPTVKEVRLVDAGGTFNDPLVPYMVDDKYKNDKGQIWNFDFSQYVTSKTFGNLDEISKLNEVMSKIERPFDGEYDFVTLSEWGDCEDGSCVFPDINGRTIIHCPLHGIYAKKKLMGFFPTLANVIGDVKQWDMPLYIFFQTEWFLRVRATLGKEEYK